MFALPDRCLFTSGLDVTGVETVEAVVEATADDVTTFGIISLESSTLS